MGESCSKPPGQEGAFGRPFEVEEVRVDDVIGTNAAPDGYIKDLERIPPLKELRALWERSVSRILPPRR